MNTLFRLINTVFSGEEFQNHHPKIASNSIYECFSNIPYQLSVEQKQAVINALQNDISYVQGPPGTGKSFTISALCLVAMSLGQKVLVTSQQQPAVKIVWQKITQVIGDSGCLLLSDDPQQKARTKKIINDVLSHSVSSEYNADREAVLSSANSILVRLSKSTDKLLAVFENLNQHYRLNESYIEALDRVSEIFPDEAESLGNLPGFLNDVTALDKCRKYIQECKEIRDNAFSYGGKVPVSEALRLKLLITQVVGMTGIGIESYREFREDYLEEVAVLCEDKAKAYRLSTRLDSKTVDYLRDSQLNAFKRLYEWDSFGSNLLSTKLRSENESRVSALLSDTSYGSTLRNFTARLRWKIKSRVLAANKKIDFAKLFDVFPIVLGEIKALHPYLPFEEEIFDLVVVDEASQVNLAEIMPILFRAKKICIVGDHKQLGIEAGGLYFMNKFFEQLMWQRSFSGVSSSPLSVDEALSKSLLVTQHSILDLFRNESNSLLSEKNFCSLKEHFRSLPMLAEFTSSEFYKDEVYTEGLRIMTSTPDRQKLVAFKDLHVEGTRTDRKGKKFHPGEAFKVIELIKNILNGSESDDLQEMSRIPFLPPSLTIGVVSFISDQVQYISECSLKELSVDQISSCNLLIGTADAFQGNERDVMIFTPSVDASCSRSVRFMEESRRFNVATSRAKYFTFFVHGTLPANMERMNRLVSTMSSEAFTDRHSDLLPRGWGFDLANLKSRAEVDLGMRLHHYVETNSYLSLSVFNRVVTCGLTADFVIYSSKSDKAILLEIDGKYAIHNDKSNVDLQTERLLTLRRAGWNVFYYDYLMHFKQSPEQAFNEFANKANAYFAV
ncbi:P-loop containing nucleoside triphosphate hydrolase [Synechococcus sp. PROS-9-1]|uniref:DEAD/DEAH box helicase n=1 Tax=Synechococcus sp. PROS-9-1 TaxID=1968775 RepID=UPI001647CEFE|nr:AAA domain-containing protein [Synechococcus sp. PROS-9-1]QNJ32763.1 P-loop containing nucleoside triphosphate hydrolase [Synechococcus sp. PROS-9-1]